jgi:hypothetical protein
MAELKREPFSIDSLSAAERKRVDAIKAPLAAFKTQYQNVLKRVDQIGQKFVAFYDELKKTHGPTRVSWPAYVKLFFPDLPDAREDREKHQGFLACQFLRQRVQPRGRGARGAQNRERPTVKIAAMLSTLLAWIKPDAHPLVWTAVEQRFQMNAAGMKRLRDEVAQTKPLISVPKHKPVSITAANVVKMPTATPAASQVIEGMKAAHQRVTIGARARKAS